MSEKNQSIFIDFGSSKLRLGAFNQENLKNIFILEEDCTSNFGLKNFDIEQSNEIFKNLIKSAEKILNSHIKKINLMIDTPDMFSIDISLKKISDDNKKKQNEINSLLQEAKNLIQNNYLDKKIIHIIVKKFYFDDKVYYNIPEEEFYYQSLIVELKFICFSKNIWEKIEDLFKQNYITIDNLYCSSFARAVNCNTIFEDYKKKVVLDIGYGKSAISIFQDDRILYFNILPVGGKHITNDLALLLKIGFKEAEVLKKKLNESDATFIDKLQKKNEVEPSELTNQVIFARVDEIIKLNLTDQYFNNFLNESDDCALIFIGDGSKILNKNSIYLEEKFDFFKEISFFEENTKMICEAGFNFHKNSSFQEVNFLKKETKNRGLFERFFHLFS